jgi:catecholate siderophore receptor
MVFQKTRPALLAAFALQQLSGLAAAQNTEQQLPAIRVQGSTSPADADYASGVSSIGGKTLTPLRDIPQSLTVINRAVLEAQGAASLQEALRNVPGITIGGAEGGQIGNNINLRGFTARTDIYLDGARDRGQYYRDTYYLESVEVLKGPSSMLFGRGGTGGVINQARKQALLKDQNEISASVSTSGSVRSTGDFNRRLSDTSAARVSLMAQHTQSTRDVIENQDFGIAPTLRLGIGTATEITLSALLAHNHDMPDYGVPAVNGKPAAVGRNTFFGLTDDRTIQDVGSLSARIEHKISPTLRLVNHTQLSSYRTDARETGSGSVGSYNGGVFTPLTTAAKGNLTSLPPEQLFVTLNSHDRKLQDRSIDNQTDVIGSFSTGSIKHSLIGGLELSHDSFDSQASSRSKLPIVALTDPAYLATPAASVTSLGNHSVASADAAAVYLNDTLELNPQWKIVAGVRHDRFKADLTNTVSSATPPLYAAAQTVSFTSVRSGLIYQPTDSQSYYASYGSAFNPSLEQLSVTSGLQNVAPEKTHSVEAGGKWDLMAGQLSLTAAWFDTKKSNARSLIATGVYQLDGEVEVKGIELGVTGRITRDWQITGGYTHLNPLVRQASVLDGTQGKTLANTPRNNATLWSSYKLSNQWEVGGGFSAMSQRYASNTNVVAAAGYVRWDATIAYHQPAYDIRLNLLNLTGKNYIDGLIASDGGRSVPAAGPIAQVTVAYRF